MSWISVDFEEPVPPMMPMVSPERMCRSMFESAIRLAVLAYLKLTPSKSTEPSRTSVTACGGEVRELVSPSTSAIRCADSVARVIMTNTMESIIRLLKIWKLYVSRAENCPTSSARPRVVMIV